jgi:uncharacterized protein (TIGR02466 family)
LWPTIVLEREVPGHAAANRALLARVLALDERRVDLTTGYRDTAFLDSDEPDIAWLARCIHVSVRDYFVHVGVDYDVRWRLHAWPNVNRFGDYHDYHNHPRSYLSGTYYVQVPTEVEDLRGRGDLRPGRITLYDPRSTANMTAIRGDPNVEPEYTVTPTPGLMLVWPSFVNHFVHPNLSSTPRVSISFNVMLDWSDEYLPEQ